MLVGYDDLPDCSNPCSIRLTDDAYYYLSSSQRDWVVFQPTALKPSLGWTSYFTYRSREILISVEHDHLGAEHDHLSVAQLVVSLAQHVTTAMIS